MNNFPISVIGLMFDIFGAFWLAKSIIWRSKRNIENESMMLYGGNPYLKKAQHQAKLYGWFGFILLFTGFLTQAIGQIYAQIKIDLFSTADLIVILLLFSLIINDVFNKKLRKIIPNKTRRRYGD